VARQAGDNVKWLEESFVDLDGYSVGLDAPATLAALIRVYEAGAIPAPSYVMMSGRGVWCKWRLVDERNPTDPHTSVVLHGSRHRWDTPLRGSKLALDRWRVVQNALVAKLAHLGADAGAADAGRWQRVPGSLHSGTGERVSLLFPDGGRIPLYTIAELATHLGVTLPQPGPRPSLRLVAPTTKREASEALSARGKAGYLAARLKVYQALQSLSRLRGGFTAGHRNAAIMLTAAAGLQAGVGRANVTAACQAMARACRPAYRDYAVAATVRSIERKLRTGNAQLRHRYDTIAKRLDMTAAERIAVGLVRRQYERSTPKTSDRRELIRALVADNHGVVPTSEAMRRQLAARGFIVAASRIRADYKLLGLQNPHTGGRPKPSTLF
jgi:hypothetical protein